MSVNDFEKHAAASLPKHIYDHIRSGADEQQTLSENKLAFERYRLRPRVLRDVSEIDLTTSLLGQNPIPFPIGIQATAAHQMVHPLGEVATAKCTASLGTIMVLSSYASKSVEEVASAILPDGILWYQLYVAKNKARNIHVIRRVEKAGCTALVVTIDTPWPGQKYADERNNFKYPSHIRLPNIEVEQFGADDEELLNRYGGPQMMDGLTWEAIDWLCSITTLPVIIKGVLTAETAKECLQHQIAGIMVSNHGGRQLDGVLSTIDALPEVVQAVQGSNIEVYLDGGVTKGTDVLKALAMGAKAVFIGRPAVWGLAYDGESGAKRVLEILRDEFRAAMALTGCASLSDINPSLVTEGPYTISQL